MHFAAMTIACEFPADAAVRFICESQGASYELRGLETIFLAASRTDTIDVGMTRLHRNHYIETLFAFSWAPRQRSIWEPSRFSSL